MTNRTEQFTLLQRVLHWAMAIMALAMLFIGVAMVSTLRPRFLTLIAIHRPLGIAILVLALVRLMVRLRYGAPSLPESLPTTQVVAAKVSHVLLYVLMIAMPFIGWGMLSAGGYPIILYGPLHLPEILPHDDQLHAILRSAHTVLAYVFFITVPDAHCRSALSRVDPPRRCVPSNGNGSYSQLTSTAGACLFRPRRMSSEGWCRLP